MANDTRKTGFTLPQLPPKESLELADRLCRKSKRRSGVPVRKIFLRVEDLEGTHSESSLRVLQGAGREGGAVSVKLYLSILLLATKEPHEVKGITNEAWARILGLEDPAGKGKRRIGSAIKKLEKHGLIKKSRNNSIILCHESGGSRPYTRPIGVKNKSTFKDYYFQIDLRFWKYGYIQAISSAALTTYLIILAESKNGANDVWFTSTNFQERYKFSANIRTNGSKELRDLGLIKIKAAPLDTHGEYRDSLYKKSRRNLYTITSFDELDKLA